MEVKKSPKADLENKKLLFREIGFVVVLAMVLLAFEWSTTEKEELMDLTQDTVAIEEEIVPITQEQQEIPPEMPKIPVLSDVIDIVDDDIVVKDDLFIDLEDNANLGVDIIDYVAQVEEEVVEEEAIPFALVETKPMFQGGDANNFSRWVATHLQYPEIAKENGLSGKVFVQFVINQKGEVQDVKIARGVDPALDKEAIRVVQGLPKWKPGSQRGKPVKVSYTVPINFQLN